MSETVEGTTQAQAVDPLLEESGETSAPIVPVSDSSAGGGDALPPTRPAGDQKGTTFESLAVAGFIFGMFAIVIALFAVGLAARAVNQSSGGGGGGSSDAPSTVDVTLADFSIDPDEMTIAEGGTLNLTNAGGVQHDIVVDGAQSDMLDAGATGSLELSTVDPGTYTAYCSVPGHREAGMEATVTVE